MTGIGRSLAEASGKNVVGYYNWSLAYADQGKKSGVMKRYGEDYMKATKKSGGR